MLTKAELFKTNLFSNYPESAPAYTPKPLTDEEREQLITLNMAEVERLLGPDAAAFCRRWSGCPTTPEAG